MLNLAAFTSDLAEVCSASPVPDFVEPGTLFDASDAVDRDGVLIPAAWRLNRERWEALPLSRRRASAKAEELRRLAREARDARRAKRGPGLGNYSTAYTKDEARRRGWRVIQSEYRDRFNKLHDCPFGSDVVAMNGNLLLYVQGGCQGSRGEHRRRFDERTEVLPLGARFLYWEFARSGELTLEEEWAKESAA